MFMTVLNEYITELDVDMIVNFANKTLLGGGGVDGIIYNKAGPKLITACRNLNGCKEDESKITNSYNLRCDKIIHTIGPVYNSNVYGQANILKNCYMSCMRYI